MQSIWSESWKSSEFITTKIAFTSRSVLGRTVVAADAASRRRDSKRHTACGRKGSQLQSFSDHVLIRWSPRVKWTEFSEATRLPTVLRKPPGAGRRASLGCQCARSPPRPGVRIDIVGCQQASIAAKRHRISRHRFRARCLLAAKGYPGQCLARSLLVPTWHSILLPQLRPRQPLPPVLGELCFCFFKCRSAPIPADDVQSSVRTIERPVPAQIWSCTALPHRFSRSPTGLKRPCNPSGRCRREIPGQSAEG